MERTMDQLRYLQSMPLDIKIKLTESRIHEWVNYYYEDGIYVAFSGGKDSTVLLDIARKLYPNIKAMFVDVPTQYAELKQFVQTFDNVDIIKPKMNFFQVCEKYGFPMFSKEISHAIHAAQGFQKLVDEYNKAVANGEDVQYPEGGMLWQQINGTFKHKVNGEFTDELSRRYNKGNYKFMLEAPFSCSDRCCFTMKKNPSARYEKETGRVGMTAQMADESELRTKNWLKYGCNIFGTHHPKSNPMSFWTEQDVLKYIYIYIYKLPICSVYGDVVIDYDDTEQVDGQMTIEDWGKGEMKVKYKTTGAERTGCVLCAYGAHLEARPNRFEFLRENYPQWYRLLDVAKNNGVTYREAIEWVNEHSNINIPL